MYGIKESYNSLFSDARLSHLNSYCENNPSSGLSLNRRTHLVLPSPNGRYGIEGNDQGLSLCVVHKAASSEWMGKVARMTKPRTGEIKDILKNGAYTR